MHQLKIYIFITQLDSNHSNRIYLHHKLSNLTSSNAIWAHPVFIRACRWYHLIRLLVFYTDLTHMWYSVKKIWTDKSLTVINSYVYTEIYQTLVLSITVFLYASKTWILLATDTRNLESLHTFNIKCHRHILEVTWNDRIHNTKTAGGTELPQLMD